MLNHRYCAQSCGWWSPSNHHEEILKPNSVYFCEELELFFFLIEYFTFLYNNSLWFHEVVLGFLACQLYTVGKEILFAPITDISSHMVARTIVETGFLLCRCRQDLNSTSKNPFKNYTIVKGSPEFFCFSAACCAFPSAPHSPGGCWGQNVGDDVWQRNGGAWPLPPQKQPYPCSL